MRSSSALLALMITAFAVFACTKNNGEDERNTKCRIAKTYLYDGGVDSFMYTFNKDGSVGRVTYGTGDYYNIEYNGAKIIRRNFFRANAASPYQFEIITYNFNGTINHKERFNSDSVLFYKILFTYGANKLISITEHDAADVMKARYRFTYTINNITRVDGEEYWGGSNNVYHILYSYDTRPNFFSIGQQSLLIDGYFNNQVAVSVPYALSDNNVKELEFGGVKIPVDYALDERGNPTAVKTLDNLLMKAVYECP